MKFNAQEAWEQTLKNRHSDNPKDYLNEAITQAIRDTKAWCSIMISYEDYKEIVSELVDNDFEFTYKAGMLTISWYDGGASKMYNARE